MRKAITGNKTQAESRQRVVVTGGTIVQQVTGAERYIQRLMSLTEGRCKVIRQVSNGRKPCPQTRTHRDECLLTKVILYNKGHTF